ncbi:MAG TPA: pyridoxal-phosphate dependent enzyme, partial [Spirochaetia bacterium]|nr:pyridoxal-phosphate dependent enzyme [Spirochaetia bacterium]
MTRPVRYRCVTCGKALESSEVVYLCPSCSAHPGPATEHPRGCLSVTFEPARRGKAGQEADIASFLPLPLGRWSSFPAGNTPLVAPRALRERTGIPGLWLKNDTVTMSGSLKDRASILVAEQALAAGETRVVLASTGNAGASMACAGA